MISVILGAQWGDEGKAKVVDYLSSGYDYVVRFQGGANAGHTVYTGEKKYVFHLIPSGILRPDVKVVIGNGVVFDCEEFFKEIDMVSKDIDIKGRILISNKAHVVMPYHKLMDKAKESETEKKIGTTLRGIGPAYIDKYDRIGIRVGDLFLAGLKEKIQQAFRIKEYLLKNYYHIGELPSVTDMMDQILIYADRLREFVTDSEKILHIALEDSKNILFEGAQGSLLDIDFGTYPYVTSSNTISAGLFSGSGIGYRNNINVIGILKAYTTRVGEGPFPTEDKGVMGELLRKLGDEYGATTGRPRRCGSFDCVLSGYSINISGINEIFLTKLDVLDEIDTLKVCIDYELDGKIMDYPPSTAEELSKVKPIYQELPGWNESIKGITLYKDLPVNARAYIEFLENRLKTGIRYISTGKERNEVIKK